jgi:hypothetical protein
MNSNCAVFGCTITNRYTTMDTKALRQKILDLAIHGKLVPQDPNDEPASVLLERIKAEKERLIKEGKIKRSKKSAKTSDTPHYENVPFEVPEGWMWTTLGVIGTWQSGGTPSRSNKSYYGGNIPWLKTGDLNDGYITHIPEFITEEAVVNSSAKLNPVGSVLIAMYGATIVFLHSRQQQTKHVVLVLNTMLSTQCFCFISFCLKEQHSSQKVVAEPNRTFQKK